MQPPANSVGRVAGTIAAAHIDEEQLLLPEEFLKSGGEIAQDIYWQNPEAFLPSDEGSVA